MMLDAQLRKRQIETRLNEYRELLRVNAFDPVLYGLLIQDKHKLQNELREL